ncbi:hypothetical protein B0J11DRAFT_502739 [Dendryphion nanum]|uniref:Uncharacterized protein n=1 Tax=Dendryphion nanum TaxID=256645 RepID=A0A9P9EDL5_9PLEO|nr:hypothetical protein B0J11DRAFT_502739 [Dendryphion nanum]
MQRGAASPAAQAESAAAAHGWAGVWVAWVRGINGNPRFERVLWAPSRAIQCVQGSNMQHMQRRQRMQMVQREGRGGEWSGGQREPQALPKHPNSNRNLAIETTLLERWYITRRWSPISQQPSGGRPPVMFVTCSSDP